MSQVLSSELAVQNQMCFLLRHLWWCSPWNSESNSPLDITPFTQLSLNQLTWIQIQVSIQLLACYPVYHFARKHSSKSSACQAIF